MKNVNFVVAMGASFSFLFVCFLLLSFDYVAKFRKRRRRRKKEKSAYYAFCFQESSLSKRLDDNWPSQRIPWIKEVTSKTNLRWKLLNIFQHKINNQICHFTRTFQENSKVLSLHIFRNTVLTLFCMRYLKGLPKYLKCYIKSNSHSVWHS